MEKNLKWRFAYMPNYGAIDRAETDEVITTEHAEHLRAIHADRAIADGFLDDRVTVNATEYDSKGYPIGQARCTKYDQLDWFVNKNWIDYIIFEDGAQGLYRSDDQHIIRFDDLPEVDAEEIAQIVEDHFQNLFLDLCEKFDIDDGGLWDYYWSGSFGSSAHDVSRQLSKAIAETLVDMGHPEKEKQSR